MYHKLNRAEPLTFCENPRMLQILKQFQVALPAGDSIFREGANYLCTYCVKSAERAIFRITVIFLKSYILTRVL